MAEEQQETVQGEVEGERNSLNTKYSHEVASLAKKNEAHIPVNVCFGVCVSSGGRWLTCGGVGAGRQAAEASACPLTLAFTAAQRKKR